MQAKEISLNVLYYNTRWLVEISTSIKKLKERVNYATVKKGKYNVTKLTMLILI